MEHHPTQSLKLEVVLNTPANVKVIKLSGPLTIHNFFDFQQMTRERPIAPVLIIDLTDVPYIDSAALGSFVGVHVSCEASGRKYALVGVNDRLQNLFDLTHTRSFLVIYGSVAEAQASLV